MIRNSGVVTVWSIDAFLTLVTTDVYRVLTPELISRLAAFVDAYVLFDEIILPEHYETYPALATLGGREIFKYIKKSNCDHSHDLSEGVTFDFNLSIAAIPQIILEDRYWSLQHDPDTFEPLYEADSKYIDDNLMSFSRLWQWGMVNELSSKFDSVSLIPNSVIGISEYDQKHIGNHDYIHNMFVQYAQHFQNNLISVSKNIEDPFIDSVKNFPPFLACLLDRAKNREHLLEVLKSMRHEYRELRGLRHKYMSSIENAKSVGEKSEIVKQWDNSWNALLKNEFRRTGFFSKKVSTAEIVKMTFDPLSYLEMVKFLTQKSIDFWDERRLIKRVGIFCKISAESDSVYFDNNLLYQKFGIDGVVNTEPKE